MKFKPRRCYECGKGTIRLHAAPGRTMAYKTLRELAVPSTLKIPTCESCDSEWINDDVAAAIDRAMAPAYRQALSEIARRAISALESTVGQHQVERALGLSAGYLSKIKRGERVPNPDLVAHLSAIAIKPKQRLAEIQLIWDRRLAG